MWTPPERIKHQLLEPGWPTAEEAARSLLFSPIHVGPLNLKDRTWVPAMVPWRATEDGDVTPEVIAWYRRFAEGRPAVIVVEATGIRDVPSGPLLRIGHDRFVPGLRDLVRTVREASDGETRVFIQLIDFLTVRRRPAPEKFFANYLDITPAHRRLLSGSDIQIRRKLAAMQQSEWADVLAPRELEALEFGYRERVTDTHLLHIQNLPSTLPDLFANAAARACRAGFDGVELHFAHAYTMASFLSATNTRNDAYGGSRENRARLPLEVYRSVRKEVGIDFVVGCRYLAEECVDGGSDVADAEYFGTEFARAGMDFVSLSRGGKFDDAKQPKIGWAVYPYTGRSGYECMPTVRSDETGPFGRNLSSVAAIRQSIRKAGYQAPVVAAGGIGAFQQAEGILRNGQADIIAAARQSLADPDWFLKCRIGLGSEIRRCEYTNYCEGLDRQHKQVTCKLWDRVDRDLPGESLSEDGRRRLVAPPWQPPGKVVAE